MDRHFVGHSLQMNRREDLIEQAEEKKDQLDALAPGVRDEMEKERRSKLTPEDRAAGTNTGKPWKSTSKRRRKRTRNRCCNRAWTLTCGTARRRPNEIERAAPQAHHQEAKNLAAEIENDEYLALLTNRERMKVNFDFWRAGLVPSRRPSASPGKPSTTATRHLPKAT